MRGVGKEALRAARNALSRRIEKRPKLWWSAIALLSLAVVAVLDYVTGHAYSFSLFYVAPLGIVIFMVQPRLAYASAVFLTGVWLANNLATGQAYPSAYVLAWSVAMRLGDYLLLAFVFVRLRGLIRDSRAQVRSLEAANDVKALLLRELNHRVKNSLNTVVGLISLEDSFDDDPGLHQALARLQNRVRSMAELYDLLFYSAGMTEVSMAEYLRRIAAYLETSFDSGGRGVHVRTELEDIRLDSKPAISIGIIVNEIVTDAFKHAFPDGRGGTISIAFRRSGDGAALAISDDGVGYPPDFSADSASGFGLKLVSVLARDLEATLNLRTESGARVTLDLPLVPHVPGQ